MVNIGIHWYSDYPLGLALGYTFGMIAAHPEGYDVANFGKDDSHALSVQPTLIPGGQLKDKPQFKLIRVRLTQQFHTYSFIIRSNSESVST